MVGQGEKRLPGRSVHRGCRRSPADPKTADTLKKLIKDADDRDDAVKAIILCRMLFTAKPKKEFRRPMIGQPAFLGGGDSKDLGVGGYKDWQLEPIELVDGVPFLVVAGYQLAGEAEPASKYLSYCLEECDWNGEKYKPKDKEAKALAKLLADERWKEDLAKHEKEFLTSQVK